MIHILVVDDETDVTELFLQRFRKEIKSGFLSLDFAFSGSQALEFLQGQENDVQLILSDINMPGMTSLELLKKLREVRPDKKPPVFIITAYGDDKNYQTAMDYGANDFLTKPLDFDELKRKVVSLVA